MFLQVSRAQSEAGISRSDRQLLTGLAQVE